MLAFEMQSLTSQTIVVIYDSFIDLTVVKKACLWTMELHSVIPGYLEHFRYLCLYEPQRIHLWNFHGKHLTANLVEIEFCIG